MTELSDKAKTTIVKEYASLQALVKEPLEKYTKDKVPFSEVITNIKGLLRHVNTYCNFSTNYDYLMFNCATDNPLETGELVGTDFMIVWNLDTDIYKLSTCVTAYVVGENTDNDLDEYELDIFDII
jgi:hypothetical protein